MSDEMVVRRLSVTWISSGLCLHPNFSSAMRIPLPVMIRLAVSADQFEVNVAFICNSPPNKSTSW